VQCEFVIGSQAPLARVPFAAGAPVSTTEIASDDLIPSLLVTSDVLVTGWFAADARAFSLARRSSWSATERSA
jgi:hypothetical protein